MLERLLIFGERVRLIKKQFYEQENLQLNISKARQKLKWKPKYSVTQSVKVTTEWYKKTLIAKKHPLEITTEQINEYMKNNFIIKIHVSISKYFDELL